MKIVRFVLKVPYCGEFYSNELTYNTDFGIQTGISEVNASPVGAYLNRVEVKNPDGEWELF